MLVGRSVYEAMPVVKREMFVAVQVIKDYQLFMVVGVLLVVDMGIMTTWQVTDPFYRDTKQMEPYVSIL